MRLIELPDNEHPTVALDGELHYLSPLSRDLLGAPRHVHPTPHWQVEDGRLLLEVYNETHGPRE